MVILHRTIIACSENTMVENGKKVLYNAKQAVLQWRTTPNYHNNKIFVEPNVNGKQGYFVNDYNDVNFRTPMVVISLCMCY